MTRFFPDSSLSPPMISTTTTTTITTTNSCSRSYYSTSTSTLPMVWKSPQERLRVPNQTKEEEEEKKVKDQVQVQVEPSPVSKRTFSFHSNAPPHQKSQSCKSPTSPSSLPFLLHPVHSHSHSHSNSSYSSSDWVDKQQTHEKKTLSSPHSSPIPIDPEIVSILQREWKKLPQPVTLYQTAIAWMDSPVMEYLWNHPTYSSSFPTRAEKNWIPQKVTITMTIHKWKSMMNQLATRLSSHDTRLDSWEKDVMPYLQMLFLLPSSFPKDSSFFSSSCSSHHQHPTPKKNVPSPKKALPRIHIKYPTPIHRKKRIHPSDLECYFLKVQQATVDRIISWDPHSLQKPKRDPQQEEEEQEEEEKEKKEKNKQVTIKDKERKENESQENHNDSESEKETIHSNVYPTTRNALSQLELYPIPSRTITTTATTTTTTALSVPLLAAESKQDPNRNSTHHPTTTINTVDTSLNHTLDKNHGNTVESITDKLERLWSLRISDTERQQRIKEKERQQSIAIDEKLEKKQKEEEAKQRMDALLRPLTPSEKSMVEEALYGDGHPQQIIAKNPNSGDTIQRDSIRRLRPGKWLNDEVIHYFYVMLANRDASTISQRMNQNPNHPTSMNQSSGGSTSTMTTPRRSHFFKSFFLTKLLDEGGTNQYTYSNVKRWSKNVPGKDIFSLDKIFIPVNLSNVHWACAVIFMQEKRIQFYDSMGGDGKYYLDALFRYVKDEWRSKSDGKELPDASEWRLVTCRSDTPRQQNGFDCGVFTCMFADFLSMGYPLSFTQDHVTQCRERIALSIMQGSAIE